MVTSNTPVISAQAARQDIIDQVRLRLGELIVDVELEQQHYNHGLDAAIERYRQRSENAVEESYSFLELQVEQTEYILPKEIIEVRQIFRRTIGGQATGGGTHLEPFSLAFTNLYLLQAGRQGGLATFDFFHQYQETVGRLFGQFINFSYDSFTHKLTIFRRILSPETVLLQHYNYKPDEIIINDIYSRPWIRDWTIAVCKMMLAEGRGKFNTIAGPGSGTTLNGPELKTEAVAEFDRLETEIKNYGTGENPPWFVIG